MSKDKEILFSLMRRVEELEKTKISHIDAITYLLIKLEDARCRIVNLESPGDE